MTQAQKKKLLPTILFDPGHGGLIDGVYQTSGKRSPIWPDGRILYEGEFNRAIVKRLCKMMKANGYPYRNLVDTEDDVPLKERTDKANDFYTNVSKNCIYLSIHANAGGGTGHETFTSEGQTGSDPLAEIFIEELCSEFPELKLRSDKSDGDHDKEANFYVLRKTIMRSILIECAFMDTLSPDCELLMSEDGRNRFAHAIFTGIQRIILL